MASDGPMEYRIPTLEAFPWQEQVINMKVVYPPEIASKGDRYIVPKTTPSTSNWYRHKNSIAWYDGKNWFYDSPEAGWVVYVGSEEEFYRYNGTDWIISSPKTASVDDSYSVYVKSYDNDADTDDLIYDGTASYPFPNITTALEYIETASDNNSSKPYTIILLPGIYEDNIRLNSTKFCNLSFVGYSANGTFFKPRCDYSVLSNEANNCLQNLHFSNITFSSPIKLEGQFDYTAFATNLTFSNCMFEENADIELININTAFFKDTGLELANISLYNVANFKVRGGVDTDIYAAESLEHGKTFKIEADSHINEKVPMQWGDDKQCNVYLENCVFARNPEITLLNDSICNIHVRLGAIFGRTSSDNITIPLNTNYTVINGVLKGNYTYVGNVKLVSGFVSGSLIDGGGDFNCIGQPISQIYNDSSLEGATLKDALESISTSIIKLEDTIDNLAIYDLTLEELIIVPTKEIT